MIKQEIKNDTIHTFSDAGFRIRIKGTDISFLEAYENQLADHRHEWEEVQENPS